MAGLIGAARDQALGTALIFRWPHRSDSKPPSNDDDYDFSFSATTRPSALMKTR
jgi:hypothetical protein